MSLNRFCSFPFTRAHLSVNGDVYLCCAAWLKRSVGNFFRQPWLEIWNSERARDIRATILDGSFRYCLEDICPRIVTGVVEEEFRSGSFSGIIEQQPLEITEGPAMVSLNYDPSCNLTCPSCRNHIQMMTGDRQRELIQLQDRWLENGFFHSIKQLTVSGSGEVMASRVYMDLFQKIDISRYPDLRIILRTNGQLLNKTGWQRLENVRAAIDTLSISIDAATADTYHRLRRGGDWDILMNNLRLAADVKKQYGYKIRFNFVAQSINYREMPAFVTMAKRYGADIVAFARLLVARTPDESLTSAIDVAHPDHPEHDDFLKLLNDPRLRDPSVRMGNLAGYLG